MGDFSDRVYFGTKTILETDVREWHHECVAVNHLFITGSENAVALCAHKLHVSAACALREPDMSHGRKLELAHHDFLPLAEIQRAGNAVNARRGAGYDGNFIRAGIDELRKSGPGRFIPFHP